MKILYVTSLGFRKASSASIRNIGLLNGLVNNGHKVDLLTIKYPENFEDKYLKSKVDKRINIFADEIPIINKYLSTRNELEKSKTTKKTNLYLSKLKKLAKTIYFFPDVDKYWIKTYNKSILRNDYDLIISSSDTKTSHFVSDDILKNSNDIKWYQIWGDPWEDDINLKGYSKKRVMKKEKYLIESADKVFYVSLPTTKNMKQKYKYMSDKIEYLGRSYFESCEGNNIGINKEWIFTYTGIIDDNRNIFNLVKKIDEYNNQSKKRIILNIYGYCDNNTRDKISKYKCVNLKGIVDFKDILDIYKESDVLVFIDNGKDTTQIPGKLYDYFGTDRPILALMEDLESSIGEFIQQTQRCIVKKNSTEGIDFDFINNIKKERILDEYSNINIANKILKK